MSEETIIKIIDEIAETAKEAIRRGYFAEPVSVPKVKYFADYTVDELKKAADLWDEAGLRIGETFRSLEKSAQEYLMLEHMHNLYNKGMRKYGKASCLCERGLKIGDEIVFIGNGCAVKDRISRVLVETENGHQVYIDDVFRTMDELVEHLKQRVHG